MKQWLISSLLGMLSDLVTIDMLKKYGDKLFDFIEDAVKDSDTKWDDATVLPIINMLRKVLDVPDND